MIEAIHLLLQDVALEIDKQTKGKGYPTQSPEYTIWTQDLSRQPACTKIPLFDQTTIGMKKDVREAYRALRNARKEYQERFLVFYVSHMGREKRMKALDCSNRNQLGARRGELHAYIQGMLDWGRHEK